MANSDHVPSDSDTLVSAGQGDPTSVPLVHGRTQRLSIPIEERLAAPMSAPPPGISSKVEVGGGSNAPQPLSADHVRSERGHKTTQMFFLEHREPQGELSESRRGLFAKDEFLPTRGATLIIKGKPAEERPVAKPQPESYAKQAAQVAFARTMNFLDELLRRTAQASDREALRGGLDHMPGPPRNLPKDDVVIRFERFGRLLGYYGPVLWFIPPRISLINLKDAGMLDPQWWWHEPNFPKGFQSLSPYEPDKHEGEYEPGYWVLALPGIMPGTSNRSYIDQTGLAMDVACNVGLAMENGYIRHSESIRIIIGGVADLCVFFAIAQHAKELMSEEVMVVRSSNVIRTYQPDWEEVAKSALGKGRLLGEKREEKFSPSMQEICHVSVAVQADKPLQLMDYPDTIKGGSMGLTPFFIPRGA